MRGVVAAGHPDTADAAAGILREGGNAFDAAVAAVLAACACEPVLASPGGGGFLMAGTPDAAPALYDFFTHTPRAAPRRKQTDFRPIRADFGIASQEFHIGNATIATPGLIAGLFRVHTDLGRMPLRDVFAPAIDLARRGIAVNAFQAQVFDVVEPIYTATPAARAHYASPGSQDRLLRAGDRYRNPHLADFLDALTREGAALFYRGEIAARIAAQCRNGGYLTRDDLETYAVVRRRPLELEYRGTRLALNPPPACGGVMVQLALQLLQAAPAADAGALVRLARAMQRTQDLRADALARGQPCPYDADAAPISRRGTTHISIIDGTGNIASVTVSNGEGCGEMLADTGFMLNNMLGEADLNPLGFHCWPPDTRLASMMCPTLIHAPDGRVTALGSGGSNRIRSAILQVILNLVEQRMGLAAAVRRPRLHVEDDLLSIEGGLPEASVRELLAAYPDAQVWPDLNLFFGGAHAVRGTPGFGHGEGAGDPRRAGTSRLVK